MRFDHKSPEYASVESFVQFLMDDERTSYYPGEIQAVAKASGHSMTAVAKEVQSYGFSPVVGEIQRVTRGFNDNPNGTHPHQANPTFTTSGSSNILGLAGFEG